MPPSHAVQQADKKRSGMRLLSRLFGGGNKAQGRHQSTSDFADVSDSMFMDLPDAWRPRGDDQVAAVGDPSMHDKRTLAPRPSTAAVQSPSPSQPVIPAQTMAKWVQVANAGATRAMGLGLTALLDSHPRARHDCRALVLVEKTMQLTARLTGENGLLRVKPDILRRALAQLESLGVPVGLSPLREAIVVVLENVPEIAAEATPVTTSGFASSSLLDSRSFEEAGGKDPEALVPPLPTSAVAIPAGSRTFRRSVPPPSDDEIVTGFADTVPFDLLDLALAKRNEEIGSIEEAQDALASVFDCALTTGITDQDSGFGGITTGQLKGIDAQPISVFSALDDIGSSVSESSVSPSLASIPVLADVVEVPASVESVAAKPGPLAPAIQLPDPPKVASPSKVIASSPEMDVTTSWRVDTKPSALHLLRESDALPSCDGLVMELDPHLEAWPDTSLDNDSVFPMLEAALPDPGADLFASRL